VSVGSAPLKERSYQHCSELLNTSSVGLGLHVETGLPLFLQC